MQKDNPGTSRLEIADDSINQENKEQQVLQHIWTLGWGDYLDLTLQQERSEDI